MDELPAFELPEPVTTIVLADAPYTGLEYIARVGLSPATYFGVRQWLARADAAGTAVQAAVAADDGAAFNTAYVEFVTAVEGAGKLFAELGLKSWAVTRDGKPVPADVAGMATLGVALQAAIVASWSDALGTVAVPLSGASTTGKPSRTRTNPTTSTSGRSGTATGRARSRKKTSGG